MWNDKLEYLKDSRINLWNEDYMDFLIQSVWKITAPVDIIDFGCGMGFLGSFLLPKLPAGSSYTGIDIENTLLTEARSIFENSGFQTTFIEQNLLNYVPEKKYHIAISQAFLIHAPKPEIIVEKMAQSVVDGGKVICIEPNWAMVQAGTFFYGINFDEIRDLGVLQRECARALQTNGLDRYIGIKIPVYMAKLGLKNVSTRVNDRVTFVNPANEEAVYKKTLKEFPISGQTENNKDSSIQRWIEQGFSKEDAGKKVECEINWNKHLNENKESMYAVSASSWLISFGTK